MYRKTLFKSTIIAVLLAASLLFTGTAHGDTNEVVASFEGESLSLAESWDNAESCVVLSKDQVECFTGNQEADEFIKKSGLVEENSNNTWQSASAFPRCARGWLCLFDGENGTGRRLIFKDEYWQDLNAYGFANQVSSWRNNQGGSDIGALRDTTGSDRFYLELSRGYGSSLGKHSNRADEVHG